MDRTSVSLSAGRPEPLSGPDLGHAVQVFVRDYLGRPENNNLGPGATGPAWEDVLVGFSDGADELYLFLKDHIGAFHWTPAEAFALGSTSPRADAR